MCNRGTLGVVREVRGSEDMVCHKAIWSLQKSANRGFRGYPVATIGFYGPDDRRATKVAVGIIKADEVEADPLERWYSEDADVRDDPSIVAEIEAFLERQRVKTVAMSDQLIGCPHEEGKDYPDGQVCPQCPFWADRDRWQGVLRKEQRED
jgi:hypothetical protein